MLFLLIAQQTSDPLSGGAGWVGAGLLGLVLSWLLLKHLPDKDKQFATFVSDKDTHIDDQRKEFTATLSSMMTSFRAEASAERAACEKHFGTLAESMNKAFSTLGEQLSSHSQRNQQWLELLKTEVDKAKARPT